MHDKKLSIKFHPKFEIENLVNETRVRPLFTLMRALCGSVCKLPHCSISDIAAMKEDDNYCLSLFLCSMELSQRSFMDDKFRRRVKAVIPELSTAVFTVLARWSFALSSWKRKLCNGTVEWKGIKISFMKMTFFVECFWWLIQHLPLLCITTKS